jgi:hypothetical protein
MTLGNSRAAGHKMVAEVTKVVDKFKDAK